MAREWEDLINRIKLAPDIETALELTLGEIIGSWNSVLTRDERKAKAMSVQLGEDTKLVIDAILDHPRVFKPVPPVEPPVRGTRLAAPPVAVRPTPVEKPPVPPAGKRGWRLW